MTTQPIGLTQEKLKIEEDAEEQRLAYLIEQMDTTEDVHEKETLFNDIWHMLNG